MPREIKTTIAVDGEAAFKRAINDANTSIRNMGTQLTLAQAQFKKDGDAMKLMETRSKALKSEIEQQEEIVKALEKAVKDSSDAFGENSDKTEKWEAELNRAKAKLVNLQSELTLNNSGLDRNGKAFDDSSEKAADYQATLQTIGKGVSFENITGGIGRITSGFEGAVTKVFNFAKAMRDTLADAGSWADDLLADATKYNMDVEELQRWRNAADFIDTDVETIISARDRLSRKMTEGWTEGSGKEKKDMWELLGIDLTDSEGKMRDQMDVMFEVGETLRSMVAIDGNDVRASELAMQVFGKSYRELLPLFSAGQEKWNQTVSEQRVVSKEHVEALGEMDDANQQLENSWETLKYTALSEIAPVMTDAATALSDLLNEFNDWMSTEEGQEAMDGLAEALRDLFSGLKDISFKDAIETAKNALNDLKDALEWLKDHKDDVTTALGAIGLAFAGIKVASLATNIGKIVSGFQTLWQGANKPLPTIPGTDTTPTTVPTTTNQTSGGDGGKSSPFAVVGTFLRSTVAKVLGGGLAFGATLFQNAYTPQGNDDILDEEGQLTDDARLNGYYLDKEGKLRNTNLEPVEWEVPKATEKTESLEEPKKEEPEETPGTEEMLRAIGTELTDREKAVTEAWWESYRKDPTSTDTMQKWDDVENTFYGAEEKLDQMVDSINDWLEHPEEWNKQPEEIEEWEDLDPVYSLNQKLDAVQDWWDAYRNAESGADTLEEENNAFDFLQEALGDEFADFWTNFIEKSGEQDLSGLEDLPDTFTEMISENADVLDSAVQEMKTNTESGKTVADKVAGADFKKFNNLPAEIETATQRGAANGVSGIVVRLDGNAVGRLVAPYVNQYLGSMFN